MELMAPVRALHVVALALLAGAFLFPPWVLPRTNPADEARLAVRAALARLRNWALVLAFASWLAWLLLAAASVSGQPLRALDPALLDHVIRQTHFGQVWMLRLALLLLLVRYLAWPRRARRLPGAEPGAPGVLLVLAVIVAQAWAVQAGAAPSWRFANDALHLLAAVLWIGGLRALFLVLRHADRGGAWTALALAAGRRFARLSAAAIAVLALSGYVDAQGMAGGLDAFTTSIPGRVQLAKLFLFAGMLAIAAVNRFALLPRLAGAAPGAAVRGLRRNIAIQLVFGTAILAISGALAGRAQGPAAVAAAPISVVAAPAAEAAVAGMKAANSD